ncbi:MAG: ABC transporter ATP-binding protein [Cyanobacteria bacterium RM1_2_2]|nr:ABC transporter ATP-binding protein [Cyanobacteria bacterium RM1_2_2]
MTPAITLSNVSKVYGNGTVALKDLNLTIGEGQFVSLVGPSGCGKSTVLRIVAGLGKMSAGHLYWGGNRTKQRLAFVFQEAALMPWATVQENVRLPLKLAGVPKREAAAAVAETLQLVELQGFEHCYPRELSGGMKMRVSIARALVTKPELLLMDEPFGALDEMTRSKLNSDLLDLWQQKQWTAVFVTHNIYEAVYLSNRVVVMASRPGRVVADVAIEAPYPRPEGFRTTPRFNEYCWQISQALSQVASCSPDERLAASDQNRFNSVA